MSEQTLRLIIIDDEDSLRIPLVEHLKTIYSYDVDAAANGREALQLLQKTQGRYDVALIDQVLEGAISGLDLLRRIKTTYPEIQVIIFTGWGMREDEGIEILRQGAYRYFAKPYNLEELALTIRFAAEESQTKLERQYMAALVRVSQGLTQTLRQDQQLTLAWDFVKEQLDVSTFFVGLATPDKKEIYFPLAYDDGRVVSLDNNVLGKDRSKWGFAGYVLKTDKEIVWSTLDELEEIGTSNKISPILVGNPSASGFCIPLKINEDVHGVISAQSYKSHVFSPIIQNALRALGGQLSVAIENSRLFYEADQKTKAIAHQANSLSTLQDLALTVNSSLNLNEILTKACKIAVEFFRADHSGLVLFDSTFEKGVVEAEYPNLDVRGQNIPLRGIPAEEKLMADRRPLAIFDVGSEESLGEIREILLKLNIQSILFMPVIGKEGLLGSFSLDAIKQRRKFTEEEIKLCKTFADQVAVAIENARLYELEARRRREADTLREAALALTTTFDQQEIFKRILRELQKVVPYDSASVQLLKDNNLEIIGGHGFPNLSELLGISFPIDGDNPNREVMHQKSPIIVPNAPMTYKAFTQEPHSSAHIRSWLGVPMLVGKRMIGMIALDKREPNYYTPVHAYLAQSFASQAAIAIENARLYHNAREGREYLKLLYQASSAIISPRDPNEVLQTIVDSVRYPTGAWRAVILLMDDSTRPRILASSGFNQQLEATNIRDTGISRQVVRTGLPRFISDIMAKEEDVNPHMVVQGTRAAACLPLPLLGKNIGVLWIQFHDKHSFSEIEQQALQLYANQSAIAYDNARHVRELEQLRLATEAMAGVEEVKHVLQKIVEGAKQVLDADFALLWPYDSKRKVFIPEELVAVGVSESLLDKLRKEEPRIGRTTASVLKDGYIKVVDISLKEQVAYLGEPTLTFLHKLGVHSFQSVLLAVAGEPLGVLHVDYKSTRHFGDEDRKILEHFAYHAALTLKKARLLSQVKLSREEAHIVARVSTLGKLDDTLKEIVKGARDVLSCDIATLYTFNEKTKRFVQVEGVGLKRKQNLRSPGKVAHSSSLWRIIELDTPYYHFAENAPNDRLLQGDFVHKEKVLSALGIQLRFSGECVGVMFINHRTLHRFTEDEINNALEFADQAAVAIRNSQLHAETQKRAEAFQELYDGGKVITSALTLEETLQRIEEHALRLIGIDSAKRGCFSHIALLENNKLRFIAASSKPIYQKLKKEIVELDLIKGPKIGIAGKAIKSRATQYVPDVNFDQDYIPLKSGTSSQLSVLLSIGDRIIGVLSIEHPDLNAFTSEDIKNIELLAAQAAIAMENARRVSQLKAMRFAAETMARATNVQEILKDIVASAKKVMNANSAAIWQYDSLRDSFVQNGLAQEGISKESASTFQHQTPQRGGIAYTILERGFVSVENIRNHNSSFIRDETRSLLLQAEIVGFLGIALKVGKENLGVLYINYNNQHVSNDDERKILQTFANQAALALRNVNFLEQQNKLREAFQVVGRLSVLGDLDNTLRSIVSGAQNVLGCDVVTLYTYDQEHNQFGFPPAMVGARFPEKVIALGGVLEESVVSKIRDLDDLYVAADAQKDPIVSGAFVKREKIKITVGIPLAITSYKVGVMFVSYRSQIHFNKDLITDIRLFANQAAIAIRNAQVHGETIETLAARTGMAWMGMASSTWRHAIEKRAITIREETELLRRDLKNVLEVEGVSKRLNKIERLADQIREKPITPPLSSEEGVQSVSINSLIRERTRQLWSDEPFKDVSLRLELKTQDSVIVRASPEWLRRALDILLENAVDATTRSPERSIRICSHSAKNQVKISIIDSGTGVPEDIRGELFRKPIEKLPGEKGLGIGLMFSQLIVQAYGGSIRCQETGPKGTTMVVSLPLENEH